KIAEGIGATQGIDVAPGQHDLVALGQAEQQFGLQRAFEVQVQFGFGQGVEPVVHGESPQPERKTHLNMSSRLTLESRRRASALGAGGQKPSSTLQARPGAGRDCWSQGYPQSFPRFLRIRHNGITAFPKMCAISLRERLNACNSRCYAR